MTQVDSERLRDEALLRLMREHLPKRVHDALTYTVWKDSIDVDYPTIDLKNFAAAVAKLSHGESEKP